MEQPLKILRSKVPTYDVRETMQIRCIAGLVISTSLSKLIIQKMFLKTAHGMPNKVPKEKYLYTSEPLKCVRNTLNLGAKVMSKFRTRLIPQNEATVARGKYFARLKIFSIFSMLIKLKFKVRF